MAANKNKLLFNIFHVTLLYGYNIMYQVSLNLNLLFPHERLQNMSV